MERKNPADMLFSGALKQRFKSPRRTQFDVEIFGVRQKTQKQVEPLLERKIIRATFAWVAGGDDDRRGLTTASVAAATGQDRHLALEWTEHAAEVVESKLKKVRRLMHGNGETEIGGRGDNTNDKLVRFFDRPARYHIISNSKNQERAMIAPFVACSRDDRN